MLETLMDILAQYGVPIFAMIALGWFSYKQTQDNRTDMLKREEKMNEQMDRFADCLESFNTTLTSIDKRLEAVEECILTEKE